MDICLTVNSENLIKFLGFYDFVWILVFIICQSNLFLEYNYDLYGRKERLTDSYGLQVSKVCLLNLLIFRHKEQTQQNAPTQNKRYMCYPEMPSCDIFAALLRRPLVFLYHTKN